LPGLVELFAVGAFGDAFEVGGFALGGVTGVATTGVGVGVGALAGTLTGAGDDAGGAATTGAGAFSTPLGNPAGLRATDGRVAELFGRAAAGAAGWLRAGAGTAAGVAAWCTTGRGAGGS
jgi:hypothetical protein